jgi:hypothetical protein
MVGAIGGVRSVFTSAVSGIRSATDNFARSAANIAHQSVARYEDTAQFSSAGRALAQKSAGGTTATEAGPSLEQSLVDQGLAKNDLAANVASLRTADEVMKKLVEIGSRR